MAIVTELQIGTVPVLLTAGFEAQGFAVTEVSGLSDYGEHTMGTPGSVDVEIQGVILPGVNPVDIRAYFFSALNPYKPFILQAKYSDESSVQATAYLASVKCDIHAVPTSVTVSIRRQGWFGQPVRTMLNSSIPVGSLFGTFEFKAPVTLELVLTTNYTDTQLGASIIKVFIGAARESTIEVDLSRIRAMVGNSGLLGGTIIRVVVSLDYHAYLLTPGRILPLPILGRVNNGMVPPSKNPKVELDLSGLPEGCSAYAVLTTRNTFLTI